MEPVSYTHLNISEQFNVIEDLKGQLVKLDVRKTKLEQDLEQVVNNLWVEYELTPNNAGEYQRPQNVQKAARDVNVPVSYTHLNILLYRIVKI